MISINFFYKYAWTANASNQREAFEISAELEEALEEIRKEYWPDEITQNISFDIYWNNNEYSGIHNYRVNGNHLQTRYTGYLKIDVSQMENPQGQITEGVQKQLRLETRIDSESNELK